MSLVRYLFGLTLFPSLVRALTPCGRTSVPRPQSFTPNSGEKQFLWTVNHSEENSCAVFTDSLRSGCALNQCIYRTTILAAVAFLDAFQKVADMATNSRGKGECFSINSGLTCLLWSQASLHSSGKNSRKMWTTSEQGVTCCKFVITILRCDTSITSLCLRSTCILCCADSQPAGRLLVITQVKGQIE